MQAGRKNENTVDSCTRLNVKLYLVKANAQDTNAHTHTIQTQTTHTQADTYLSIHPSIYLSMFVSLNLSIHPSSREGMG